MNQATRTAIQLLGLFAITAILGCSDQLSGGDHGEATNPVTAPPGKASGTTNPGGANSGGTGAVSPPYTSSSSKQGTLTLSQSKRSDSSYDVGAVVLFSDPLPSALTSMPVGPSCTLLKGLPEPVEASQYSTSAGDIAIATPSQTATMAFSNLHTYEYSVNQSQPFFLAGETVTVGAKGAAVPAFQASLIAPSAVTLTYPVVDAGPLCTFPKLTAGMDMDVVWTRGAPGDTMKVDFVGNDSSNDSSGSTVVLSCAFDAGAGSAKVPNLGGLDQLSVGVFGTEIFRKTVVNTGDYAVEVELQLPMPWCYVTTK